MAKGWGSQAWGQHRDKGHGTGTVAQHRDRGHGALPPHRDRPMGTPDMAKGQGHRCWHGTGIGTQRTAQMGTQGAGTGQGHRGCWHGQRMASQGAGTAAAWGQG